MLKVAVASSDGKVVNQHFGRTKQFLIFQVEEGIYRFLELRTTSPACRGQNHNEGKMEEMIETISDCKAVLVSQIGAGATDKLLAKGIEAFIIPIFIDDALKAWMEMEGLA
ncbi:dinitrogenase iron-molybdenum cofactor biosynthesis protein [Heliorestis acidaminivorans]|uniref:Dinitrogenase iron-molybdenum cofactor biosynthesis protein n=1 Tax=Heliorestis acidaminivorans TaxID=553427 RepID=A0A6I0F3S2_9FIRM|nr:NifB/NifX family molybdenum-iron cluster-binding protein [Heliorestis acidaminivorans]KAB2954410.1 dinitrogenase iron-molybdenum cofactor biosynthesis protein [Heliorestis acidaminivorans]